MFCAGSMWDCSLYTKYLCPKKSSEVQKSGLVFQKRLCTLAAVSKGRKLFESNTAVMYLPADLTLDKKSKLLVPFHI